MSEALTMSKIVPERIETFKALWCRKNFCAMGPQYRQIRSEMKDKMDRCYWCKYEFKDGEMMALAAEAYKGNKILCQQCAEQLLTPK